MYKLFTNVTLLNLSEFYLFLFWQNYWFFPKNFPEVLALLWPLFYIINNKDNRFILENFVGMAVILESKFYDLYCYLKFSKSKINFQWHFLVTGRYKHCDYRWTSFFQHCVVCIYTKMGWPDPPESVCLWNWSKIHALFGRLSHKRIFPGFDLAKNIKRIYLVAL